MNLRKAAYFGLLRLRGQALGSSYERILQEDREGIPPDTTRRALVSLLSHCKQNVPYYSRLMQAAGDSYREDPEDYLRHLPVLTKSIIRNQSEDLKSADLARRHCYISFTSGSTGEPVRIIQDWFYADRAGAITLLFSRLAGREIGELELSLWGSSRDIIEGSENWRVRLINRLTRTRMLDAFRMTPQSMREFIKILNSECPKLVLAYAEAIYELARFAEREGIAVLPQAAVMTSAGTLYPFMRDKIIEVFQCRVFNRYGSREVGDVACERPGCNGLWVAPWGNYVEIVDGEGNRVPDGTEGEILVTSLNNYAMPLIRYGLGDRGILAPAGSDAPTVPGQRLQTVLGRTVDTLRSSDGTLVHGFYFVAILLFRDWVLRVQVVQKGLSHIVFRIVRADSDNHRQELDEVAAKTQRLMGDDCKVDFEFVDDIPAADSGKFRYTVTEIPPIQ